VSQLLDENYGVYGDVTYRIIGGFSINAGLRYYEDQQTFDDTSAKATPAGSM
jgi:hypothetical protein